MTALTAEEARALTEQICQGVGLIHEAIVTAWRGEAWKALSYSSWADYCESEFRVQLQLSAEDRRAEVAALRAEGMSLRSIGSGLGVGKSTVDRDLADVPSGTPAVSPAPVGNPTPAAEIAPSPNLDQGPTAIRGTDGKTYPASRPTRPPVEPSFDALYERVKDLHPDGREAIETNEARARVRAQTLSAAAAMLNLTCLSVDLVAAVLTEAELPGLYIAASQAEQFVARVKALRQTGLRVIEGTAS